MRVSSLSVLAVATAVLSLAFAQGVPGTRCFVQLEGLCDPCNTNLPRAEVNQCVKNYWNCVVRYTWLQSSLAGCTQARTMQNYLARTACYDLYETVCQECTNAVIGNDRENSDWGSKRRCDQICYRNNAAFLIDSGCWPPNQGRRLLDAASEAVSTYLYGESDVARAERLAMEEFFEIVPEGTLEKVMGGGEE